jgi:hypothetical protein
MVTVQVPDFFDLFKGAAAVACFEYVVQVLPPIYCYIELLTSFLYAPVQSIKR